MTLKILISPCFNAGAAPTHLSFPAKTVTKQTTGTNKTPAVCYIHLRVRLVRPLCLHVIDVCGI